LYFFNIFQKCLQCAEEDARQRKKFRFSALRISLPCAVFDARQRTIAARVLKNARQSPFAVQNAVVCALPCVSVKNTRQRLCRAFLALRRASKTHGEGRVSRSESTVGWLLMAGLF
jgi:hypothetical protein